MLSLRPHCKTRFVRLSLGLVAMLLTPVAFAQQLDEGDDLFQFPPETPSKRVRGAVIAESLGRSDLALGYLQDLVDNQPGTNTLLQLRQEFGIGTFLDLSANPSLAPAGRQLLRLINEASLREPASASTVETLIEQLGSNGDAAKDAILRILSAEAAAAAPLLNVDITSPEGAVADQILKRHARRFRFGLLAELSTADKPRQIRILKLLAEARDERMARDILPFAFGQDPQIAAIAKATFRKLTSRHPVDIESDGAAIDLLVEEALQLIGQIDCRFPTDAALRIDRQLGGWMNTENLNFGVASLARAVQLVDNALAISPDSEYCLAAQKVCAAAQNGFPSRWPDIDAASLQTQTASATANPVDAVALEMAIGSGSPAAILELLVDTPTALAVLRDHPQLHRPLLIAGDTRVRLLGSGMVNAVGVRDHRIDQLITVFGTAALNSEAVVIDSRRGEGLTSAAVAGTSRLESAGNAVRMSTGAPPTDGGLAAELGLSIEQLQQARLEAGSPLSQSYGAATTNSGTAGFVQATNQMSCELVLLHSNALRWDAASTVANLRADFRTRDTPIVIYGPPRDEARTEVVRNRFPGVWFFPEPLSELTFHDQLRLQGVPGPVLSAEERASMRKFARTLIPQ